MDGFITGWADECARVRARMCCVRGMGAEADYFIFKYVDERTNGGLVW